MKRSPEDRDYRKLVELPSKEMTEDDWTEIMNAGPEDVEPGSLAVPPGWEPKQA